MESVEIVDLFCGGGGASTGFHQIGMKTKIAFDIQDHCVNTYNENYPNTAFKQDIKLLRSEEILRYLDKKPFLVTASPPCEPYTAANEKRIKDPYLRMFDDPTGRLMIDTIQLISDLEPKYYVIENVVGILEGHNKSLIIELFDKLELEPPFFNLVEASEWGVPSRRKRIIISNIPLISPKLPKIPLLSVLKDLPAPNFPSEFDWHTTTPLNENLENQIPLLLQGEGLIYFKGARKDYRNFIRLSYDKIAPVIMGKSRFVHPLEDRLLTPFEHAKLMTFPDHYNFAGNREEVYDIIGEAVPPKLAFEIGKQILNHYNED